MKLVKNSSIKVAMLVTMIFSLFIFQFAPTASAYDEVEQKGEIIAESVYYNVSTEKYVFDSGHALENGLTQDEVSNAELFFESLSPTEVAEMNEEIGFDKSEYIQNDDGIQPAFVPIVLVPIVKYLIGTVGAVIIYHVVTYGIIKACKNLEGDYWFFTDFCKTNGWLK